MFAGGISVPQSEDLIVDVYVFSAALGSVAAAEGPGTGIASIA